MSATNDRLGTQASKVSMNVQEMGGIVRDAAHETLGQVRENATEHYEQGRKQVQGVMSTCEQFVRQRPVQSVLIAAGIGLLCGRFGMRR